MSEIQDIVLSFVQKHTINHQENRTEGSLDKNISEELAISYGEEVLATFNPADLNAFHKANEILFDYISPSKKGDFLKHLETTCARWSKSALCYARKWEYVPKHPPNDCAMSGLKRYGQCISDQNTFRSISQIKSLDKIPVISENTYPKIYQKLQWFINTLREIDESEIADTIEASLDGGRYRYSSDMEMAQAYADPRVPGTIVFSKTFFERTWGDDIRGVDNKPLVITDDEIIQSAKYELNLINDDVNAVKKAFGIYGDITIDDLERIGKNFPSLKPSTIKEKLQTEIKKNQPERFKYYFGGTPTNIFPAEMPSWIILLSHEFRHTIQQSQDKIQWSPEWSRGSELSGSAYYRTLSNFMVFMKFNNPYQALSTGREYALSNEANVNKRRTEIAAFAEREATEFGVLLAKKILNIWKQTADKP